MNKAVSVALGFAFLTALSVQSATLEIKSHDNVVPLVELYTSEGCSSCPPADRALSELGRNLGDELRAVALGFHVDYWDYLGWPDKHAKKAYTQRQRIKGKANKQNTIYTPEFFVAGVEVRGGSGRLVDAILESNQQPSSIDLHAFVQAKSKDLLRINVNVVNRSDKPTQLQAVLYENAIKRDIKAGENRGVLMTYDYVVREHSEVVELNEEQSNYSLLLKVPRDAVSQNLGVAIFAEAQKSLKTMQAMHSSIASVFE